MKKILPLIFLFLAIPAFAKITIFQNKDALIELLNSDQLSNAIKGNPLIGELHSVEIEATGEMATRTFKIQLVYRLLNKSEGSDVLSSCVVDSVLESIVYKPIRNITASKLQVNSVSNPSCQN